MLYLLFGIRLIIKPLEMANTKSNTLCPKTTEKVPFLIRLLSGYIKYFSQKHLIN